MQDTDTDCVVEMLGGETHICSCCGEFFDSVDSLESHFKLCKNLVAPNSEEASVLPFSLDNKGLFGCANCEEVFQSEEELVVHQEMHMELGGRSWDQQMEDEEEMDYQESINHSGTELEKRDSAFCSMVEYNDWEPSTHSEEDLQKSQHGNIQNKVINSSGDIVEDLAYKCEECSEVFNCEESFNDHKHTHQNRIYQCSFCPKEYPNLSALRNHFQTHTKPQAVRSSNRELLDGSEDNELKDDHPVDDNHYDCGQCVMILSNEADFHQHQMAHENQGIHETPLVMHNEGQVSEFPFPMNLSEQELLRKIKKEMEESDTDSSYGGPHLLHICGYCGKTYDDFESLKIHSLSHTNDEMPAAEGSTAHSEDNNRRGAKSRRLSLLQQQKSSSTPQLPKSKSSIKNHLRTHTAEKRFQCTDCGKAFRSSRELICHKRVHTGERPCHCPVCSRGFSSKLALRQHQRTHKDSLSSCAAPLSLSSQNEDTKNCDIHPASSNDEIQTNMLKISRKNVDSSAISVTDLTDMPVVC